MLVRIRPACRALAGLLAFGFAVPRAGASCVPVVAAASGDRVTVVLRADGTVWSLGSAQPIHGPLSDGGEAAVLVPLPRRATAVAAGSVGVALDEDGAVWAWGSWQGQPRFERLPGLPPIAFVGVESPDVVAVDTSGVAWTVVPFFGAMPERVGSFATLQPLVDIAFNGREIVGLDAGGSAWRLRRFRACPASPAPIPPGIAEPLITGGGPVIAIAAAHDAAIALDATGQTWVWGCFGDAAALDPSVTFSDAPVPSAFLPGTISVTMRWRTFFALDPAGEAWGWGYGGRLADGEWRTQPAATPVRVGLPNIQAFAPASTHVLAIDAAGDLWAWGGNGGGEAFARAPGLVRVPAEIPALSQVVDVSAGLWHGLAVTADGRAWGWGGGWNGQLGTGPRQEMAHRPLQVPGTGYVACAAGGSVSAFLKADGTAWSCGLGLDGDTTTIRWEPVLAPGLSGVIQVAAGELHVLALRSDGTVWGWGDNRVNQIGLGPGVQWQVTPAQVPGLDGIVRIGAIESSSSALRSDGSVWTWGSNEGFRMGGSEPLDAGPTRMHEGPYAQQSQGGWHSLALDADGRMTAWGWFLDGAIGVIDPPTLVGCATSTGPVALAAPEGVERVDAGYNNSYAILPDGSAHAWGWNEFGFAAPDLPDEHVWEPRLLPGLPPLAEVASGWTFTVARTRDGRAFSWGEDDCGQLGQGRAFMALDPVRVDSGTRMTAWARAFASRARREGRGCHGARASARPRIGCIARRGRTCRTRPCWRTRPACRGATRILRSRCGSIAWRAWIAGGTRDPEGASPWAVVRERSSGARRIHGRARLPGHAAPKRFLVVGAVSHDEDVDLEHRVEVHCVEARAPPDGERIDSRSA